MKTVNLNIGEAIYSLLSSDPGVSALVGTNIFPLVAPEGTQFPYIVYTCLSQSVARDKDSYFYEQSVHEGIIICTETYEGGVAIAMAVAEAMTFDEESIPVTGGKTIDVLESRFDSRNEDYLSNTFVQGLTFNLKIR